MSVFAVVLTFSTAYKGPTGPMQAYAVALPCTNHLKDSPKTTSASEPRTHYLYASYSSPNSTKYPTPTIPIAEAIPNASAGLPAIEKSVAGTEKPP